MKTIGRGEIIEMRGQYFDWSWRQGVVDGTSYLVMIKDEDQTNSFRFGSPYSYHKKYPEVDELQYYTELIDLFKAEFGIW